jgi:hypothetical protein
LVDVQVELEAHLEQQAPLDDARRHLRRADGAKQDGVEGPQLVERGVGQDLAVVQVALAAELEVDGLHVDAGGPQHLDRLRRHLRPDAVAADHGDAMCCHCAIRASRTHCRQGLGDPVGRSVRAARSRDSSVTPGR